MKDFKSASAGVGPLSRHDSRNVEELDPREWDFRRVCEEELPTAILYEYTRSCPSARSKIEKWHARKLNFKQLAGLDVQGEMEPFLDLLREEVNRVTNAAAVEIAQSPSVVKVYDSAASLFLCWQYFLAPKVGGASDGWSVATAFESIDHPWERLRMERGDSYLKARLKMPRPHGGVRGDLGPDSAWQEIVALCPGITAETLLIDWNRSTPQLVESFRKWVQGHRPDEAVVPRSRGGRPAKWEYLRWLAAYRVREKGYNYAGAQALERSLVGSGQRDDPHELLPSYGDAPAWGKAAARAKALLAGDFAGSVVSDFRLS